MQISFFLLVIKTYSSFFLVFSFLFFSLFQFKFYHEPVADTTIQKYFHHRAQKAGIMGAVEVCKSAMKHIETPSMSKNLYVIYAVSQQDMSSVVSL